jgi:hypothetical protein
MLVDNAMTDHFLEQLGDRPDPEAIDPFDEQEAAAQAPIRLPKLIDLGSSRSVPCSVRSLKMRRLSPGTASSGRPSPVCPGHAAVPVVRRS